MTLKRRVFKLCDIYTDSIFDLINEYWYEAIEKDAEATALWDEFLNIVETSELKPPCMYQPDRDYELRKRNWVMFHDQRAKQIADTLLIYVDSYVDSKGGIFAEPKSGQR